MPVLPMLRLLHQAAPRSSERSETKPGTSELFQNCSQIGSCFHEVRSLVMQNQVPPTDPTATAMPDIGVETEGAFDLDADSSFDEIPMEGKQRFNISPDTLREIIRTSKQEGYISATAETAFVVCYVLIILAGVIGNVLVGYIIWRKKTMRTPRNLYIINLTFSDLSMCTFCMPFTLIQLLNKDFNLGPLICKLIQVIQGTNIMVSISTIVAIAADRYAAIVVGLSDRSQWYVGWSLAAIWVISIVSTLPLFYWYKVVPVKIHHILLYERCVITWPSHTVKYSYTVTLMILMYVIPIIVLSSIHAAIKRYLSRHMTNQHDSRRAQKEIDRNRKTTMLLTAIAVAFAVSWLPWQIVNMMADFDYSGFQNPRTLYTVFGSCHLLAMSTACTNPILYGWLNTNLRRELLEFLPMITKKLSMKRQWSLENTTKQDQGESPTRAVESVTYSTVVFNTKNSPRILTRTLSPASPVLNQTSPLSRKPSRSTPSPTTEQMVLLTLKETSPRKNSAHAFGPRSSPPSSTRSSTFIMN